MKIDDATAAFAAWMRQLPSHLVLKIGSKTCMEFSHWILAFIVTKPLHWINDCLQVKLASLEKLMNLYQEGDPNQRSKHVDQFRHVCTNHCF